MTAFKTQNPERAKSWVFAINDLLLNRHGSDNTVPFRADFFSAFPAFESFFRCDAKALEHLKSGLRELRAELVDHFDIPAAP